jgi:hypothetical protein
MLFVERELTRAFAGFVAGIRIDVHGEGHRLDLNLNSSLV